jgi:hypothetical protein
MVELVKLRAYLSPTLVLLAFDWSEGGTRNDFLGFAIRRTPPSDGDKNPEEINGKKWSWLPNRLSFQGPGTLGQDFSSKGAPIQKFMWWDARYKAEEAGVSIVTYTVIPVTGTPTDPHLEDASASSIEIGLPFHVINRVGTWFNRAVVSSQSFSSRVEWLKKKNADGKLTDQDKVSLRTWLSNGLGEAVGEFINDSPEGMVGTAYHMDDQIWVIPAMLGRKKRTELVIDWKKVKDKDTGVVSINNEKLEKSLSKNGKIKLRHRTRGKIMHNKFLVQLDAQNTPVTVMCGSANYTTGGLTSQANLVHTFESAPLAKQYVDRVELLTSDPSMGEAGKIARWSSPVTVGDLGVRVFFSPEKKGERLSIDEVVTAIHKARSSVLFCLFTPTDDDLRNACFAVGDTGKMMFGLVNRIAKPAEDANVDHADVRAAVALYHRSRDNRDVYGKAWYSNPPSGFFAEKELFPGDKWPGFPPVLIHHKFIVIDGETSSPVIYSGSANMSNASLYNNDENLLEFRNSTRLAQTYMAEFFRLYEHYRARALHERTVEEGKIKTMKLRTNSEWAEYDFKPGDPKYRSRQAMSRDP